MIEASLLRFDLLAEDCLLISWPQKIDFEIVMEVRALSEYLNSLTEVLETVPAYASLAVYFDMMNCTSQHIQSLVLNNVSALKTQDLQAKTWVIPVCYDRTFGLDHDRFWEQCKIDISQIIELHTGQSFTVYMRGFQPGFLYLGTLPKELNLPRLENPRSKVEAGSVGIANDQTGIYPLESPGGWNIIGRTPIKLFDLDNTDPTPIKQGDKVRFEPIDLLAYHSLKAESHVPTIA